MTKLPTGVLTTSDITAKALEILSDNLNHTHVERHTMQTKNGDVYEFCNYRTGWALFHGGTRGEALKSGMTDDEMFAMMKLLRK